MEVLGYIFSLLIGVSLGLIGGGGSIFTVPILVYLFNVDPIIATTYSLFIVGITSLMGTIPKYRQGDVDMRTAISFGIPSIISVLIVKKFLVPSIPNILFSIHDVQVTKSLMMMVLFAILMLASAYSMLFKKQKTKVQKSSDINNTALIIQGLFVGMVTGLVGAGGGFLIIPALVMFTSLNMKKAVGTSLLIITVNTLIGFVGSLSNNIDIDWKLLLIIAGIAILGMFVGNNLSKKIDGNALKKLFGVLVLVMAIYILFKELL